MKSPTVQPGARFLLDCPRGIGEVLVRHVLPCGSEHRVVDLEIESGTFQGTSLRPDDTRRTGDVICLPLAIVEKGMVKA